MTDPTNDIDDLMCWLSAPPRHDWDEKPSEHDRYYLALTALVAERDALKQQRDEAHGLIWKWRLNLVDVVEVGDYMDAMTSEARVSMNDADKRALLEATRKQGGGAC